MYFSLKLNENHHDIQPPSPPIIDTKENEPQRRENFYENQQRLSQFESFASDHPLNSTVLDSIAADIENQLNQSSQLEGTNSNDNEPWELEDNSEEKLKPIPTSLTQNDSYNNFLPDMDSSAPIPASSSTTTDDSSDEENNREVEKDNYDDYFSQYQSNGNTETNELTSSKTVRFSENLQNIAVITPKDSIIQSESVSGTTSDSDETDDEEKPSNLPTINKRIIENEINDYDSTKTSTQNFTPRPDSIISLTGSEDYLPPPLPRLPPIDNKSSDFIFSG